MAERKGKCCFFMTKLKLLICCCLHLSGYNLCTDERFETCHIFCNIYRLWLNVFSFWLYKNGDMMKNEC